jgi:hypothetical protein
VISFLIRTTLVAFCGVALSGCIDSAEPILVDAKPVLGEKFSTQLYSLRNARAEDPVLEQFVWDGKRYASTSAKPTIEPFTAFSFGSGDFILQSVSSKPPPKVEYALLHKLVDGVFLGRVIDEQDTDERTRAKLCTMTGKYTCRIQTRDQLFALARATAAKQHQSGGLMIMLTDPPAKK